MGQGPGRSLVATQEGAFPSDHVEIESARVAAWLRDQGIHPGDRVVIDLKNGIDAVTALFSVARVGGIVVGASPAWTPHQLTRVLRDAGARILITGETRVAQLDLDDRPPAILTRGSCRGATPWSELTTLDTLLHEALPTDPAILIYTSGSTGAPKGVIHSHKNLVDFARIVAGYLGNTADDRVLWVLAWSFGYGLSQLLTMCWSGGQVVVPASMLPADVVKAHDRWAITGIAQVPFGWTQLADHLEATHRTLAGIRYATNAGDGPSGALLERLPRLLPGAQLYLMYGQTECFRTTYLPPQLYDAKRGAMGIPIPEVEVYVVGTGGALCGPGEVGELLHRGALIAQGYWGDPEATRRKIYAVPALRPLLGDEPVLHTGDLVRRDADGCLWFVGRSELVIKSAGFRFGPVEIEDALRTHPAVYDAVAFGVDNGKLGQAVEAAIVPAGDTPDAGTLLRHCRTRLPRYMLPRRFYALVELPRSANGKLERGAVRTLARDLTSLSGT
jgi:acyl-CoA synthetase (AMP-forming)/AMP-acid ligase II